jgi:hypothetical protein
MLTPLTMPSKDRFSACRSLLASSLLHANQSIKYLLSPQLMGMGAPTLAHLSPAKAGRLSHGLTYLASCHIPFFPHHPIAILQGPTLGLKVPTHQAKLLPTLTYLGIITGWAYPRVAGRAGAGLKFPPVTQPSPAARVGGYPHGVFFPTLWNSCFFF